MKALEREYWKIKNMIGYCVINGDKEKRRELEKKLKKLLEGSEK